MEYEDVCVVPAAEDTNLTKFVECLQCGDLLLLCLPL